MSSSSSSSSGAPPLLITHFFKPKPLALPKDATSTSKAPPQHSLLVVSVEQGRELGPATALGKKLGYKDMRALDPKGVKELVGVEKARASPFLLSPSKTPLSSNAFRLILSSTLPQTITVPSRKLKTKSNHDNNDDPITPELEQVTQDELIGFLRENLQIGDSGEIERIEFLQPSPLTKAPHSTLHPGPTHKPSAPLPSPNANKTAKTPGSTLASSSSSEMGGPVAMAGPMGLGIDIKKEGGDFGGWYSQVLTKGDMIDYYDISGCYILKPGSYSVWQAIQQWFDIQIKKLGVQNVYFPMFVSSKVLEKEKDHIEGFAPEVAWVTKAGSSDLEEPIAIRPTSETVMYPYYAKWIRSYRDLPIKYNQWNSVVRWEFKNPQPFLRTREFLWQEGHTAHLTKSDSDTMVHQIIDLYRRVYEELLAVPVIPGIKSEKEKFAGGLYTTTVEGFIPTAGRGIQGGTSHSLGQNFSKMFGISVEDPENPADPQTGKEAKKIDVWQDSWGLSTRTIGVMVMVHGDDKGLVLPPRVAELQVVLVPAGITKDTSEDKRKELYRKAEEVVDKLNDAGVRARADLREGYTPGFKYNDWEMKGIPLRLELGPKDLANQQIVTVRRDTGKKSPLPLSTISTSIPELLKTIQSEMYEKALDVFKSRIEVITEWENFVPTLNSRKICVVPWCEVEKCEDEIKDRSARESAIVQDEKAPSAGAKSLCIPFDQSPYPKIEPGVTKCTNCGQDSKRWTLFGRSY